MSRRQTIILDNWSNDEAGEMMSKTVTFRKQAQGGSFVELDDGICLGHIRFRMPHSI